MDNSQYRVLVVDDDPDNRYLLETYFKINKYQVQCAVDGLDALEILQKGDLHYDVILLDRMMPRMNGLELLTNIKKNPQLRDIPVIMQTAMTRDEDVIEGIEAGSYYYLLKPYNPHTLIAIAQAAILDRQHVLDLKKEIQSHHVSIGRVINAEFQFRSIDEGRALAAVLAHNYPDPESVSIGLMELFLNAVEHGNLCISYEQKSGLLQDGTWEGEVKRRLELDEYKNRIVKVHFSTQSDKITVQIEDDGAGFAWQDYIQFSPSRITDTHGRGIAMSRMLSFTDLEYIGKGNKVIATVAL